MTLEQLENAYIGFSFRHKVCLYCPKTERLKAYYLININRLAYICDSCWAENYILLTEKELFTIQIIREV